MEQRMAERRKCKQRCNYNSCKTSRYRLVRVSVALFTATALVCIALQGSFHGELASLLWGNESLSPVCGHRQLSDQESYNLYIETHSNLKIKLLTELDGAPVLESRQPPRLREITIVTQTSLDRWTHVEELAMSWGGILCVAVYVKTAEEIVQAGKQMIELHDRIEAQRHCRLHLQMVVEKGFKSETDALTSSYPVNALRNVALDMATTDLVFLYDIDFMPSPGLHEKLTANDNVYSDLINRTTIEGQLLIVPVFQALHLVWMGNCPVESADDPIPRSMHELRERWRNGTATGFRPCHSIAHDATSYSHFLHPLTTMPYHIQYRELYEPYFIAARARVPKFDERFRGYGKNKVAHAYNCAVEGLSFVVLPEVYLWEMPHPRSEFFQQFIKEKLDPCETPIMNVVYDVFKEELRTKTSP